MVAIVLAILAKLVVILKLGLRSISKRIISLIFLNIYTPPQHALTHIILFTSKIIDKANSKFGLKIKEALHINWRKTNLNAQQNDLSLTLSLSLPSPLFFSFFPFFCVFLSSIIFIIFDTNYLRLLLSWLHFAITSSHYNTPCITPFSFIYYFQYLYANYRHPLLS